MQKLLLLLFCIVFIPSGTATLSGFWYDGTRGPIVYDSIPYANLTVRIMRPFDEGPGQNLMIDPVSPDKDIYVGNTINRQSFDTQFVLDMEYALGIYRDRIYVIDVTVADVHYSWESFSVIVHFIFLERNSTEDVKLLESIANLTEQIQTPTSALYVGTNVTVDIDPLWGLDVVNWDISLELMYPIEVIGNHSVIDGYYLNQGGLGFCDRVAVAAAHIDYCEFERFFEDDVSEALNISYYRVQIMFIKKASLDSVYVHFRILPPQQDSDETDIQSTVAYLITQVRDLQSPLYQGNVTIRVNPRWGVSDTMGIARNQSALFSYKYYEYDPRHLTTEKVIDFRRPQSLVTPYDRCKANRRCNWGVIVHNQTTNDVKYYQRLYERGALRKIDLFLDFEDWRLGTRGFSWDGVIPPTQDGATSIPEARAKPGSIRGTHFWPFYQDSLGTDIPCYMEERNEGLVLDRRLHNTQIGKQEALVYDLQGRVDWINENIETANMDAVRRSRKDVNEYMIRERTHFTQWLNNEVGELKELNTSQCTLITCSILFNTSSLELTGAVEDTGVIRYTSDGTEVAVFSFNSIFLGPDTEVQLVGQRALALVSKTSAIINTTFKAIPGTLGGFPGGNSVARLINEDLVDQPKSVLICDLGNYCLNRTVDQETLTDEERAGLISNNVNGPGSGNLRIHPFVMRTSADDIDEIQMISTYAQEGQTLAGGFKVKFGKYVTPVIAHDASAETMKRILEDSLNVIRPIDLPVRSNRLKDGPAGIGLVNVTRSAQTSVRGFSWTITFTSAIGNIPQMKVMSFLQGLEAGVNITTLRQGNEIGGTFKLRFQGHVTDAIPTDITADALRQKLLALPIISSAYAVRSDPTRNCDDGLCDNGPFQARGYIWSIYVTTDLTVDNITPTSPTSPLAKVEAEYERFTLESVNVKGSNVSITLTWGLVDSPDDMLQVLNVTRPFSLAWGGAGGSYGGAGGKGFSSNPTGKTYSDKYITDLLGGSGGCMSGVHPFEINSFRGPVSGRGGSGGGAFELVAANDITIGTYGKLIMNGGDGEQTSEGGGGGGSGGAVLLAAGGSIVHEGELDASGGAGGFGGPGVGTKRSQDARDIHYPVSQVLAGGGGGGGRVAMFAESVVITGTMTVAGGKCGVFKVAHNETVLQLNVSFAVDLRGLIDPDILVNLVATFVNQTISTEFVYITDVQVNGVVDAVLSYTLQVKEDSEIDSIQESFDNAIGTNLADVIIRQVNITSTEYIEISPVRENPTKCDNNGENGTLYREARMTTSMYVRETVAAEGTARALFLSNRETTFTASGSAREAPYAWNGPIIPFEPSQPTRVTYYSRMDGVIGESKKAHFGTLFTLLSRGVPGLNVSSVIGVFIGDKIKHGSNFGSDVDEDIYLKRFATIDEYPAFDRWYKVDIHIRWDTQTYFILLDDTLVVKDQKFSAPDLDGIRLSVTRATDVWFDEIYVGFDNNLDFECPSTNRRGADLNVPEQRGWSLDEVNAQDSDGFTEYYKMERHYSHLETANTVPFDGHGQEKVFEDIKFKFPSGDYPLEKGKLNAGALRYLTNSQRSARRPLGNSATLVSDIGLWFLAKDGIGGAGDGRHYLYIEAKANSNTSYSAGGVAACSSQDLSTWRFEGIVFHNENLTDMVYGSEGPFSVERPTIIFNPWTREYVMWATMNDPDRELGMTAIASSPFEDGPFLFRRSLYPDGNRTRDQAAFINDENRAVLARTYYSTVEYIMPEAILQPTWESVKNRDGTINYRLNYHRAWYHEGYDNFHDIFLQRWRNEDKIWNVKCVNRVTKEERIIEYGVYNEEGAICEDPIEYKVIFGQGNPPIETKFLSPNSSDNSWWMQTSVPSVKAQPWASSYRDGYCGIRKLQDDLDINDPALEQFIPVSRGDCSNIADNQPHATLEDKLIGVQRIVLQRRAKYLAVSELTPDFMDTTGRLKSFEGELSSGALVTLIADNGQFGFGPGSDFETTFQKPVRSEYNTAYDYKYRFRQFIRNRNDRAEYSLSCVINGVCPVNFADQLTVGHN